MDSQNKDESRTRLREEALARRMGEVLDRISATGAGECPDAALIAAYYERVLQPEELEQWEGHFAGCSRCRKILAVLSASIDAPLAETEVAQLGELVAVARPASGVPARPSKVIKSSRFDWRARWLAPALGVAAVLAVWSALRAPWRTPEQGPASTLIAQAPKIEPPLEQETPARRPDQSSSAESKKAPESPAAAPQDRLSGTKAPASAGLQSQETNPGADNKALSQLKAKTSTTEARLDNEKKNPEATSNSAGRGVAATSAPLLPAAPAPQVQAARGEPPAAAVTAQAMSNLPARDKQATGGAAETDAVSPARPAADMPLNGRSTNALSLAKNAATAGGLQIQSSSGKVLWRAGSGGKIEHSLDAGRTWVVQTSPSPQDWLAGAAASDAVCWLVGRNGSIARTTDGERWLPIAPPAAADGPSGHFPDWTGVAANSALAATITSGDNRRYVTVDGGHTWRLQ
jgi:hypothetical protein